MRVRQIRFFLWTSAAVMGSLAIFSLLWTFAFAIPNHFVSALMFSQTQDFPKNIADAMASPTDLEQLAHVPLRRPLHDAPPPLAPAAKPLPPLDIRLTGTIVEPGHCRAMIQLPDGSVQLKGVGEMAGTVRILDIQQGSVTVEYFGKSVVLNVVKETGS